MTPAPRCTQCNKVLSAPGKTGLCRHCWSVKSMEMYRQNPQPPLPAGVAKQRRHERNRRKYLPLQLEAARRKVVMLEREAARLGVEIGA